MGQRLGGKPEQPREDKPNPVSLFGKVGVGGRGGVEKRRDLGTEVIS